MGPAKYICSVTPKIKPVSKAVLKTLCFKNPNVSNQVQEQCEQLSCFHMSCNYVFNFSTFPPSPLPFFLKEKKGYSFEHKSVIVSIWSVLKKRKKKKKTFCIGDTFFFCRKSVWHFRLTEGSARSEWVIWKQVQRCVKRLMNWFFLPVLVIGQWPYSISMKEKTN